MAHSHSIPIQNVVIDAWQLEGLLGELSSFCKASPSAKNEPGSFEFMVGKKTDATNCTNRPPRNFLKFFLNRVEMVELKVAAEWPKRKVVCRLAHAGERDWQNKIDLISEDEDWLKQATERVSRIVAGFQKQNTFLNRAKLWLAAATALPFGWGLVRLGAFLLVCDDGLAEAMLQGRLSMFLLLGLSLVLGFAAGLGIFHLLARLFPSVELMTGQPHQWVEKRLRKHALTGAGLMVVLATAYLFHDLYCMMGL